LANVNNPLLEKRGFVMIVMTGEFRGVVDSKGYPRLEREVLCEACWANVGWFSLGEIVELSVSGIANIFCFDCDGIENDLVPSNLVPDPGESIVIRAAGGQDSSIITWLEGESRPVAFSVPSEEAEDTCLSSSPYLHKNEQKCVQKKGGDCEGC
jgi:hypothetical protein